MDEVGSVIQGFDHLVRGGAVLWGKRGPACSAPGFRACRQSIIGIHLVSLIGKS